MVDVNATTTRQHRATLLARVKPPCQARARQSLPEGVDSDHLKNAADSGSGAHGNHSGSAGKGSDLQLKRDLSGQSHSTVSGCPTGSPSSASDVQVKIPFHHRSFSDFCGLVVRMFHDDCCVVLIDFLAREQRAYTEADIRERLKWRDNLLHQKLYYLEKQLLVQRDQNFERGSKSPVYWRISPHIVHTVQWHLGRLLSELQRLVDESHFLHEFECPLCRKCYSALDVASGKRSIEDDHALCKTCDQRLCTSNSEVAKAQVRSKQERAVAQLAPVRQSLDHISKMTIPTFERFTRADKNEQKRDLAETMEGQSKTGASSVASSGATPTIPSSSPTTSLSCGSSVVMPSDTPGVIVGGPKTVEALAGGGGGVMPMPAKAVKSGNLSLTITASAQRPLDANQNSRVIPWFEKSAK